MASSNHVNIHPSGHSQVLSPSSAIDHSPHQAVRQGEVRTTNLEPKVPNFWKTEMNDKLVCIVLGAE